MIRLYLGTLLVTGLCVGCAPELNEETSGALTINPNRGVAIPEGVTVHDADLNSDGTIDMDDLVIVGKFFGQDVPQELSQSSDLSAADTSEYIYALLTAKRHYLPIEGLPFVDDYKVLPEEATFAFRFLTKKINDSHHVVEVTVKPVGSNPILKKTITQSLVQLTGDTTTANYPEMTIDGGGELGEVHVHLDTSHYAIHQNTSHSEGPIQLGEKNNHDNISFINIIAPRTNARELCTADESVAKSWGSEYPSPPKDLAFYKGFLSLDTREKVYCQDYFNSPVSLQYGGWFGGPYDININSEEVRSEHFPNDP